MMPHGEHACELEEGFLRGCVEASSDNFDHVIMDPLEHVDEHLRPVWFVPELAAVGEDGEADGIED